MENIFEVLKTQASLEKTLNQRLDEFEARLEGSSKDLSLKDVSSDYINFKDFVYSTFTLLRQQINDLIVNVYAVESRHRKKFVLLGGVVENTNENVRELVASVITKNLGIKNCSSQSLQEKLAEQEMALEKIERQLRKKILVLFGVEEKKGSYFDLVDIVLEIIKEFM
ncbi:unnamed protein product [Parnassius apollo]|uniref:(apollo) hypothetical protein n=1 Tax=Parnassius apollo TaxID=110799 RepID=A0A8S3WKS4_PARAO|nr:unnamed protein product [Parnassius apollo]